MQTQSPENTSKKAEKNLVGVWEAWGLEKETAPEMGQ